MKPSEAIKLHREEVKRIAARYRLGNVRIFGSALHGRDTEGSDLDLLVDPSAGTTLFDLGGAQVDIEEVLGVPVELLTPGDLPPKFRDAVLKEATPL